MNVRDLMNEKPATLPPQASLSEALQLMAKQKARHVVVLDSGRVAGIVSDRDLAMVYDPDAVSRGQWANVRVEQIMTRDPVVVGSGAEAKAAAKMLLQHAFSALPVVDNGQLVGILTEKDFVRHFARNTG
jgi:acetoin utilization protein AcuB